jgi:hypothetical protein
MNTYIIKIETGNKAALTAALERLVEAHGASFYTLTVDGVAQHMGDAHLDVEQREAEAIAAALTTI